jgi:hypothetical protein
MRFEIAKLFSPHAHAEALFDAELDGDEIAQSETLWLEKHLAGCERCVERRSGRQRMIRALQEMKGTKAPEGFAGRVLLAAKTRRPPEQVEPERRMMPLAQLATGAVLALALIVGLIGVVSLGTTPPAKKAQSIEASGGGSAAMDLDEAPQFVVRAPGVGAAKARSQFTQIVSAHRGTFRDQGGALIARIPRAELIQVTQDLANSGRYKMSQPAGVELSPSMETIVIRFELE